MSISAGNSLYLFVFGRGKEHEVEKMFTLKSGRVPPADVKNVIFFVRPRLELMDIIVDNVFRSVRTAPQPGSPAHGCARF